VRGKITYKLGGAREFHVNGKPVTAVEFDAALPAKPDAFEPPHPSMRDVNCAAWPYTSDMQLGVSPHDIPAELERCKRHGVVGVSFNPNGDAVFSDRNAMNRYIGLDGKYDKRGNFHPNHDRHAGYRS